MAESAAASKPELAEPFESLFFDNEPGSEVQRYPSRMHLRRRRTVLILTTACVLVVGGVFGAVYVFTGAGPAGANNPPTAAPTAQRAAVTLPGWLTAAAWKASHVADAVLRGDGKAVAVLSGQTVTVRATATGKVLGEQTLAGGAAGVFAGTVDEKPAVVAFSATEAFVWVAGVDAPQRLDLSGGRELSRRGGAVFLRATDGSYSLPTVGGELPLIPPRPGTIPLGRAGEGIVWGSGRGTVIVAAVNGAIVSEAPLAPPSPGARVTGWVFTTTATGPLSKVAAGDREITIVTWTNADGTQTVVAHSTASGAIVTALPATTTPPVFSADGSVVAVAGHRLDLRSGAASAIPDGFVPTRFIGAAMYGATKTGSPALLSGDRIEAVAAPTVIPLGAEPGGNLLTLTGGDLVAFSPVKTSHPVPGGQTPSATLTKEGDTL